MLALVQGLQCCSEWIAFWQGIEAELQTIRLFAGRRKLNITSQKLTIFIHQV
jgi:hypothetical protein